MRWWWTEETLSFFLSFPSSALLKGRTITIRSNASVNDVLFWYRWPLQARSGHQPNSVWVKAEGIEQLPGGWKEREKGHIMHAKREEKEFPANVAVVWKMTMKASSFFLLPSSEKILSCRDIAAGDQKICWLSKSEMRRIETNCVAFIIESSS